MRAEQGKSHEHSDALLSAAKYWQDKDEEARTEVAWAASEYMSTLRQHLKQLNSLIFPLLEQNVSDEEETKITEGINSIVSENNLKRDTGKLIGLVDMLASELNNWQ